MGKKHSELLLGDGIHIPNAWKVTNQTELEALTPTALDLDKLALKQDDGTYYRLTGVSPTTWEQVSFTSKQIKDISTAGDIDGGVASSVYTAQQITDGGNA
jgi:hypothetical protein